LEILHLGDRSTSTSAAAVLAASSTIAFEKKKIIINASSLSLSLSLLSFFFQNAGRAIANAPLILPRSTSM
jgi:hypothetical protein